MVTPGYSRKKSECSVAGLEPRRAVCQIEDCWLQTTPPPPPLTPLPLPKEVLRSNVVERWERSRTCTCIWHCDTFLCRWPCFQGRFFRSLSEWQPKIPWNKHHKLRDWKSHWLYGRVEVWVYSPTKRKKQDLSDLKTALSKFICFLTTIVATKYTFQSSL